MIFLSWWPDQTHDEFVAAISDKVQTVKEGEIIYLNINSDFLERFLKVSATVISLILGAIEAARATCLAVSDFAPDGTQSRNLQNLAGPGPGSRHDRYQTLCETLGSISTIRTVSIGYRHGMGRSLGKLLQNLPHVTELVVVARREGHDFHDLLAGLQEHPSIGSIVLDVLPGYYRLTLPTLPSLPMLRKVHLLARTGDSVAEPADVGAIAALLRSNSELKATLERIDVSRHDECQDRLCKGLAQATIHSLRIRQCTFGDPTAAGRALARSTVKALQISFCSSNRISNDWAFIDSFGRHLGAESQFVSVHCDFASLRGAPECHSTVLALVQGASSCPHLECLKLTIPSWSDKVDEALARCISGNRCLELLEVMCPTGAFTHPPHRLSLLDSALRKNFSVKNIRLGSEDGVPNMQLWDADALLAIGALLRLNRSGRSYLARDAANQSAAVQVLEKVADDLNCLFFHLTENPQLLVTSQH